MPKITTPLEAKLFAALKTIAAYQTPGQLRRGSQRDWGCGYEEALEMAYENIQQTAKNAVKGIQRPKAGGGQTHG